MANIHNGGVIQNNQRGSAAVTDDMYLNLLKMSGPWFFQVTGGSLGEEVFPLIGADNHPQRFPTGSGLTGYWQTAYNVIHAAIGDQIIVTYTGTSTLTYSSAYFTATVDTSTPGRTIFTITGYLSATPATTSNPKPWGYFDLRITAMTGAISNLKMFYAEDEWAVTAGKTARPGWVNRYNKLGIVRWMDANGGSGNQEGLWAHRSPSTAICNSIGSWIPDIYQATVGTFSNGMLSLNQPSSTFSLAHGQRILGKWPASNFTWYDATFTDDTNPLQVNCTAHPFNTGDRVMFSYGSAAFINNSKWDIPFKSDGVGNWGYGYSIFTVTKVNANTFTLDGINSIPWTDGSSPFYSGTAKVTFCAKLKVGSLAAVEMVTGYNGGTVGTYIQNFDHTKAPDSTKVYDFVYDANIGKAIMMREASYATSGYFPASGVGQIRGHLASIPWEDIIAMSIETGTHPWVTLGPFMTDAYLTSLFTLFKTTMTDLYDLVPRFEFSNEVWNFGNYPTSEYAYTRAGVDGYIDWQEWYGVQVVRIADLAAAVWADSTKYKIVHANQLGGSSITRRFTAPTYSAGDTAKYPINKAKVLAFAPYMYPEWYYAAGSTWLTYTGSRHGVDGIKDAIWNYTKGGSNRIRAFRWMRDEFVLGSANTGEFANAESIYGLDATFLAWSNFANQYPHIEIELYEGLPNFLALANYTGFTFSHKGETITQQNWFDYIYDFMRSEEMGEVYEAYYKRMFELGMTPSVYVMFNGWTTQLAMFTMEDTASSKDGRVPLLPATLRTYKNSITPVVRKITVA
jgi:hypothetical protein